MRPSAARIRALAFERGGVLVLVVAAFYAWNACPYIVENDQAEFTTLAVAGGVAHPPGYPLHLLWLRGWVWLPISAAHATSLATGVVAAAAVAVLFQAARAWGARPLAATLAVGVYALAPFVARYHCLAEVFALNHLVVACVLWLSAQRGPLEGQMRAATLGLIAGLGLANHLTCVLVAPVGIVGLVRAARESSWPRALVLALGGLALGLLPYAYLFAAGDSLMGWAPPVSLGDLLDLFLRRAYGGPLAFSGAGADVPALSYLGDLGRSMAHGWAWLLLPIGLLGLIVGVVRPQGERRVAWIALALSIVLAGPVLAARFDLPLHDVGKWITRRFHLLPITLLVIPVAVGIDQVATWIAGRAPNLAKSRLPTILVTLALLARAITTLPYLARFQSPAMEREVEHMLRSLPPNAVVLGGVNELDVGTRYLQLTRGVRPDVLFVRWQDLAIDWYRRRFVSHGLDFTPEPGEPFKLQLAEHVLATGRPLFVGLSHGRDLEPLGRYPYGVVYRILPRGVFPPSPQEVFEMNRALFETLDLRYPRPGPEDETATWMHQHYEDHWRRLGDAMLRAGDRQRAAIAYELAEQLAPLAE
jgi:hypothetical protein